MSAIRQAGSRGQRRRLFPEWRLEIDSASEQQRTAGSILFCFR
jgi:hypothetical protein